MKSMSAKNKCFVSSRKGNIFAIFFAIIFSGVVFFLTQNNNTLFADIAGGINPPLFTEHGDVGVFVENKKTLTIRSLKNITDIKSMSILVMFDSEGIHLTEESIESTYSFSYAGAGDGQAGIVLEKLGDIIEGEPLFHVVLKNNEDITNIVIGDVVLNFLDGGTESLSVEVSH